MAGTLLALCHQKLMPITSTYIDLLRHGEVQGGSCYRGITNDPLSTTGWQQMHTKISAETPWTQIISSPLSRCYDFAKNLSNDRHLPLITDPDFQEINFGDWEGKTAEQIDPLLLTQFYQNPIHFTPPNGEPFNDFQQRILTAWQTMLDDHQGQHILLITHAGVIRVILAQLLGMDIHHSFRLKIAHACLSSVECFHDNQSEDFFQLVKHG